MFRIACTFLIALALAAPPRASATPAPLKPGTVFALVVTRHGVRSLTHAPAGYTWRAWAPVAPGYLSAHGYRLMTYMGSFYRSYFASIGLPIACARRNVYVYADLDQRTLETGRALIEGACGTSDALPLVHDAETGTGASDALFNGADWMIAAGKVDTAASRAAVLGAAPMPLSALVAHHRADFAALQAVLKARCIGTCAPVTAGNTTIVAKDGGLAEVRGPVDTGSSYAESLFLEEAQCAPEVDRDSLAAAMRLHVLAYELNARPAYNADVRGGNIFAHIVGLLQEKAGVAHPVVSGPDVSPDDVAFISGHDTQLGALGGILGAHWALGQGLVADDMPPGGALVFELYRTPEGRYRVRLRFTYETLAQLRSDAPLPDGIASVPVRFAGCDGPDCSAPLSRFAQIAQQLVRGGFVRRDWTPQSDAPIALPRLYDPSWTACRVK